MFTLENCNVQKVLEESGVVISGFSGTSMMPMLRSNKDRVVIEKANRALIANDVPLYRIGDGRLVLHRIVKVKENRYIIRGDNLYRNELGVNDSDIIGVLKGFYRGNKYHNCDTDFGYKLYVLIWRLSYPIRYIWFVKTRPFLSKAIRQILRKK